MKHVNGVTTQVAEFESRCFIYIYITNSRLFHFLSTTILKAVIIQNASKQIHEKDINFLHNLLIYLMISITI